MTQPERQEQASLWFWCFCLACAINLFLTLRHISSDAEMVQLRTELKILGHKKLLAEQLEILVRARDQLESVKNSERYSWELEKTAHHENRAP